MAYKQVAKTLTGILDHPMMGVIMDRSKSPIETAEKIIENWSFDLYTRKPGPAVTEDGEFVGTDLDLATFMMALADRGAVINMPKDYKGIRASTKREGERLVSTANRHGKITGMFSNSDVFSFGVRILDMNVVQTDLKTGQESVGAPRNFALTGITGDWHPFWSPLEFSPAARENAFLKDNKLWTDNKVIFTSFVHKNRWVSLYGQHYFVAKAMVERLTEDARFLKSEIDRLLKAGVNYPPTGEGAQKEWEKTETVGDKVAKEVDALNVEIDLPDYTGEYTPFEVSQASLVSATAQRKRVVYDLKPKIQFAVRTVEYAFYKHALDDGTGEEKMPGWFTAATWERDYTPPGKRNKWNRLILFQRAVGEQGVAIRYRIFKKKEWVAA